MREQGTGNGERGFTLIELLVVVAMIAIIMGAMVTSIESARRRARIQKATTEVKVISQAILAYENYNKSGDRYSLEANNGWQDANKEHLGFLLGQEASKLVSGGQIPTMVMAALNGKGEILDPWGHPYRFKITTGSVPFEPKVLSSDISAGFMLPNFYRITEGER